MVIRPLLMLAVGGLAGLVSAQNLVKDPEFKDPKAWTIVGPSQQVLRWDPLKVETAVPSQDLDGKEIGVTQRIVITEAGYYQLGVRVHSPQENCEPGSLAYRCTLGSVLDASGQAADYSSPSGTARTVAAMVTAGTYDIVLSGKGHFYNNTSCKYQLDFVGVVVRKVQLPCANLDLCSQAQNYLELTGLFSLDADLALYMIASHVRPGWLAIPGITGVLDLDPARGTGLILLPLLPARGSRWLFGTPTPTLREWPYLQILEIDIDDHLPQLVLRLGTTTTVDI